MKTFRWGNGDMDLKLDRTDLTKLESLCEKSVVAIAKIDTQFPNDFLRGKYLELIYEPGRVGSCGVDGSEVIRNMKKNKIPIYISERATSYLREDGEVTGAYQSQKIRIRLISIS